ETRWMSEAVGRDVVAPRAGARIETRQRVRHVDGRARRSPRGSADRNLGSLTSQLEESGRSPRGSADRNTFEYGTNGHLRVAPRAGARIETRSRSARAHPIRRRSPRGSADRNLAVVAEGVDEHNVAPRAGARIETRRSAATSAATTVALRAGARIETWRSWRASARSCCRSPRGSADRNRRS